MDERVKLVGPDQQTHQFPKNGATISSKRATKKCMYFFAASLILLKTPLDRDPDY